MTTEYNVNVASFSNLPESPHSWNKTVLNITPVKSGSNYRLRLGLQMYRLKTNEKYSSVIELYNRDYETWQREQAFVNVVGLRLETFNTRKFQYHYGSRGDLYYSKSLATFTKTSSTTPVFVYFTVYFDDNAGDLNTYPKEFKNQVYIVAYGVKGLSSYVDPEVYDEHEALEIDKTKMKMMVSLDMNSKKMMNVNYDLKFKDLFKIFKCYFKVGQQGIRTLLHLQLFCIQLICIKLVLIMKR